MRLLRVVESRVIRDGGKKGGKKTRKHISREEIRVAMRKLRDGKAVGMDEIPNEAWKYGRDRI